MSQSNTATQWPQLLDVDQAAEYLGTTPRHIRGLRQRRTIPATKIGRWLRFARTDLDAYITRNTTGA